MAKPKMQRTLAPAAIAQQEHENAAQDKFDMVKETALAMPSGERSAEKGNTVRHEPSEAIDGSLKPRYQQLDKVTVLMTAEQKKGLDSVAKRIMKNRATATKGNADKERITANTLMRALIDNFLARNRNYTQMCCSLKRIQSPG